MDTLRKARRLGILGVCLHIAHRTSTYDAATLTTEAQDLIPRHSDQTLPVANGVQCFLRDA